MGLKRNNSNGEIILASKPNLVKHLGTQLPYYMAHIIITYNAF